MTEAVRDDMMGLVSKLAMEAVDVPPEDREDHYRRLRQDHFNAARSAGADALEAGKISNQLFKWVREAVRIIESSGGGAGGSA